MELASPVLLPSRLSFADLKPSNLAKRIRMFMAVSKWNKDLDYINQCIKEYPQKEEQKSIYDNPVFMWNQLVWQEIWMWILIGKKVPQSEFDFICSRRNFNESMRDYLKKMLRHIMLGTLA